MRRPSAKNGEVIFEVNVAHALYKLQIVPLSMTENPSYLKVAFSWSHGRGFAWLINLQAYTRMKIGRRRLVRKVNVYARNVQLGYPNMSYSCFSFI